MILADTDVLIDYLAGVQPVAGQVKEFVRSDQLQTSAISCFELVAGAREGRRGDSVRRLVASIPVLPFDGEAAVRAAALHQQAARDGFSIGVADSLIAGIALANDVPLLTRNRRHFQSVVGLRLVPPSPSAS